MGSAIWRWWRDPEGRRDEASNSFAMFVVMLPMILGAFGIGVDMSRNLYIRTSIQNHLDMATVAGAGTTVQTSAGLRVDTKNALPQVERVYAVNRASGPGLSCIGNRSIIEGTDGQRRCWTQPVKAAATSTKVTYTVAERSRNSFLVVLGIKDQNYRVSSAAKVNQQTE